MSAVPDAMNAGVDVGTLARMLNVSMARIPQLAKEAGFPPKLARGAYDAQATSTWYIRHLQTELRRRGPTGTVASGNLAIEKLKLVTAQAEKVHTENLVRRGSLLELDAVRVVWTQRVTNAQKRLRGIPSSMGPQLTNKSDPAYIVDRLKHAIEQALHELAADPGDETDDGPGEGFDGGPSGGEPLGDDGVAVDGTATETYC